jgi:hypothetical protein
MGFFRQKRKILKMLGQSDFQQVTKQEPINLFLQFKLFKKKTLSINNCRLKAGSNIINTTEVCKIW